MKHIYLVRNVATWLALIVFVLGLLLWLLWPANIPPIVQLHNAASVAWFLLLIAACTGVVAMATVQFWKVLFLPRSTFHSKEMKSLFGDYMVQVFGLAAPASDDSRSPCPDKGWALDHLFDNPTEVVMGQLRSAADYILLRPEGFEPALFLLAGAAGKPAVEKYLGHRKLQSMNWSNNDSEENMDYSADVLVEVRFFMEQHLNLIHVRLKERWRRRVRVIAVFASGTAGLLTVFLSNLGPMAKVSAVFAAAICGGFFSWLARDIVALVERRRA